MRRQVHLVGSVGLTDAESVFAAVSETLGALCPRIPDGETGGRTNWIRWQRATFTRCDALEQVGRLDHAQFRDGNERPVFAIRPGVAPGDVDLGELGYGDVALDSFALFSRLQREGRIGGDCRFMVAVPTPTALIFSYAKADEQLLLEPAVETALMRDLDKIRTGIPADRLSIQFDVCLEVVGADGGVPLPYEDPVEGAAERIARLARLVDEEAEFGIHLCYGDPGHKHLIEPEDLGTSVAFANRIAERVARRLDFVHMPVPRGRADDAYFAPLADLALPAETRLILGLVHYTDGVEGGRARMAAADRFADSYDIATECGFGRRDPATIPELLRIHRDLCT